MRRIKYLLAYLLAAGMLCLICGGCGCAAILDDGGKTVLTQRQIEILEQSGLPADYDALTASQKSGIEAIEEMLVYLEKEYDVPFAYEDYSTASMFDDERLLAKPLEGDVTDTVEVTREWNNLWNRYDYEDDYETFLAAPLYQQALDAYLSEHLESGSYKVYAKVSRVEGNYKWDVLGNCSAGVSLFLDASICPDEETLDRLAADFGAWIAKQSDGMPTRTVFSVMKEGDIEEITQENFLEIRKEGHRIMHRTCSVNSSGSINIF